MIIKANQMHAKFIPLDTQLSNGEEIANKTKEVYPVRLFAISNGEIVLVGGKEEDRKVIKK